jgi:transketolase
VLQSRHLRQDPADPHWPDRDRLFCSPGTTPPGGAEALCLDAPAGFAAAAAVGAALAERMLAARFGRSLVDHRTWLLAAPSELATGALQEAVCIAGAIPLGRLTVVVHMSDANTASLGRFTTAGWVVRRVAHGDAAGFEDAVAAAARAQKPTLIACWGAAGAENDVGHHAEPARSRAAGARRAWLKRQRQHANGESFQQALAGKLPAVGIEILTGCAPAAPASAADAVRAALPRLIPAWPELAGLAAEGFFALPPGAFAGRAVPWGNRAHAIAGGLLGMAAHGGVLPITDVSRSCADAILPALRTAAALNLRLIFLVREDAPLPDGLLAATRAISNVRTFRPADAGEAIECLGLALRHAGTPSVLVLGSRTPQHLALSAPIRACARGGYVALAPAHRDVTLVASGADVGIALAACRALDATGVSAACVSMPCWQLFAAQDASYRESVLGKALRVGLEAGTNFGWATPLGPDGVFIDTRAGGDIARGVMRLLQR